MKKGDEVVESLDGGGDEGEADVTEENRSEKAPDDQEEASEEDQPEVEGEPGGEQLDSEVESDEPSESLEETARAAEEPQDEGPPAEGERRTGPRKGVRLNKLISTKIETEEKSGHAYVHLVDISEGGVRVNSDNPFPKEGEIRLTFSLDAFGADLASEFRVQTFRVEVVWQKELVGGMYVTGMKFVEPTDDNKTVVSKILERSSPEGRRLRFRLNRVLGVEIGKEEGSQWIYPLAEDLSVEGMRVRIDEELEVGEEFPIRLFLEFELPTVETRAKVMWREELGSGRHQVGMRFTEIDEANAKIIQDYIDKCLAKDSKRRF